MKKKHLNIILIIILIAVWGSVIKKYFGNGKSHRIETLENQLVTNFQYEKTSQKDNTFHLELINKNPFGSIYKRSNIKPTQGKRKTRKPIANNKADNIITWPKMSYHGFVKSNDKKTRLAILKVNNRLYRKREKEKINELVVIKAYEDSLVISNNNQQKTIKKINETF